MKLALIGYGKMGKEIEQIAISRGHEIVSRIDVDNQEDFKSDAFKSADVAIEFTVPHVAYANYLKAFEAGVSIVSGTTGWLDKINEIEDIDFQTLNALGLYCYDSLEKLKVYNDLATKLELFKKIMENLGITNFIFTKENGLEFMSNLTTDLSPDELSSGEQQAVILYYFLIFQVTPNSYILIDEPEISWHISWQRLFIPNLLEILKVVPLHFLIATHSPSIIHDRWDLTVELQGEPSWP